MTVPGFAAILALTCPMLRAHSIARRISGRIRETHFLTAFAFADGLIRCERETVLARPRIDGIEQVFMGGEDVVVGERCSFGERSKNAIEGGGEGGVLNLPDDLPVLGTRNVTQIALGLEVPERIECHGLDSRK
jgi:hypothetical protein